VRAWPCSVTYADGRLIRAGTVVLGPRRCWIPARAQVREHRPLLTAWEPMAVGRSDRAGFGVGCRRYAGDVGRPVIYLHNSRIGRRQSAASRSQCRRASCRPALSVMGRRGPYCTSAVP